MSACCSLTGHAWGQPILFDPSDDTTRPTTVYIKGIKHAICQGDCAKCRLCWNKNTRMAYLQHGPSVTTEESALKRYKSMKAYLRTQFPQRKDIGPGLPQKADPGAGRILRDKVPSSRPTPCREVTSMKTTINTHRFVDEKEG